jgi:diphosphomevalonate decarboxylase
MSCVRQWRLEGIPVCYTVDAGPNVHVLCLDAESPSVEKRLRGIKGVENVLMAGAGGPAKIIKNGK